MISNSYVKNVVRTVDKLISKSELNVGGKGSQPFSVLTYRFELDVTPFYNHELLTIFQNLIGMIRWMINLRWDVHLLGEMVG